VLLAVGVIGSQFFQVSKDATLKAGQEMDVADYRFVYFGNIDSTYPNVEMITSQLQIWHDGQLQEYIYPGRSLYANFANQPASSISITTFGLTDVYVFLADWNGPAQATIRVFVNPLVPLVWLGGLLMLFGGITCWWPQYRRSRSGVKDTGHLAPARGATTYQTGEGEIGSVVAPLAGARSRQKEDLV
jgi:cytochrome c-type biogenesis protein CcmF